MPGLVHGDDRTQVDREVDQDQPQAILATTRELLEAILAANPELRPQDLASAFFTVTADRASAYPAKAAREMGWDQVPLMCAQEIPVIGSQPRCIRVLLYWNTDLPQSAIQDIYLKETASLRPDLAKS